MRPAALLLALTLLAPAIPATSHEPDEERPQWVGIVADYRGFASGVKVTDYQDGRTTAQGTAYYDWAYNWSLVFHLEPTDTPGTYAGEGEGFLDARAWGSSTSHWESYVSNDRLWEDTVWSCAVNHNATAWPATAVATLLPEGAWELEIGLGETPPQAVERCHKQWEAHHGSGSHDKGPFPEPSLLHGAWDGTFREERTLRAEGNGTWLERQDLGSGTIPDSGWLRHYCPMGSLGDESFSGSCTWSGDLRLRVVQDVCPELRERLALALGELKALQPPDKGAPLAWLKLWREMASEKVTNVLSTTRALVLMGCEYEEYDPALILQPSIWYREALEAFLRGNAPGDREEALRELLAIERQIQIMGGESSGEVMQHIEDHLRSRKEDLDRQAREGTLSEAGKRELLSIHRNAELLGHDLGPAPAVTASSSSSLSLSVHSPVSLHVYAPDGSHVGWNATTGAPDVGIPGATYEGAPMGHQRITLPEGIYQVVVDELAEGHYLLDVTWNGSGLSGGELHRVPSAANRTTFTHYALDVDGNGTASLAAFPVHRGATVADLPFLPPQVPTAPDEPSAPAGGDATTGGATDAAEAGDAKATPGASILLVALALAGAALMARRG